MPCLLRSRRRRERCTLPRAGQGGEPPWTVAPRCLAHRAPQAPRGMGAAHPTIGSWTIKVCHAATFLFAVMGARARGPPVNQHKLIN
jgi:hypothetical protein